MSLNSATLWVVATPLGNPGDLSPRGRQILQEVDCVLAEDTRRAGLLCSRLGLGVARFLSFYEQNESFRIKQALEILGRGQDLALISDAGTPLMSDPGYLLVRACREAGFAVRPVPGPCAAVTALMASGLPPYPFYFSGFLPRKDGAVRTFFADLALLDATIVFYERKNRLPNVLKIAYEELGAREFCIARELTKEFEEFIFGSLGEEESHVEGLLGEITVLLGPPEKDIRTEEDEVVELVNLLLETETSLKTLSIHAAKQVRGWTAKEIYALCCRLRREGQE